MRSTNTIKAIQVTNETNQYYFNDVETCAKWLEIKLHEDKNELAQRISNILLGTEIIGNYRVTIMG